MRTPSLFLTSLCLGLVTLWGAFFLSWRYVAGEQTEIVFLDVGQGDAILIQQGEHQIVIDGGRDPKLLLARVGRFIPFWDRNIDTVIATHPDSDHIGGLPGLFTAYRVETVLTNGQTSNTETSQNFETLARERAGQVLSVAKGTEIELPEGGKLTLEYPGKPLAPDSQSETNEGSIVARFTFGETSFLLTGDLPHEETVLPSEPQVAVLKVAHHGSKYSSSDAFLDLVRPEEAVVSVGENSYGHPDPGVLERLTRRGITVRRTDQEGSIRYSCAQRENHCRAER